MWTCYTSALILPPNTNPESQNDNASSQRIKDYLTIYIVFNIIILSITAVLYFVITYASSADFSTDIYIRISAIEVILISIIFISIALINYVRKQYKITAN